MGENSEGSYLPSLIDKLQARGVDLDLPSGQKVLEYEIWKEEAHRAGIEEGDF